MSGVDHASLEQQRDHWTRKPNIVEEVSVNNGAVSCNWEANQPLLSLWLLRRSAPVITTVPGSY